MDGARGVADEGADLLGERQVLGGDLRSVRRRAAELAHVRPDGGDVAIEPRPKTLGPKQIADAQADARRLALVGRPDPLLGGPDAARAILAQAIDLQVVRQGQVRALGDHQIARRP